MQFAIDEVPDLLGPWPLAKPAGFRPLPAHGAVLALLVVVLDTVNDTYQAFVFHRSGYNRFAVAAGCLIFVSLVFQFMGWRLYAGRKWPFQELQRAAAQGALTRGMCEVRDWEYNVKSCSIRLLSMYGLTMLGSEVDRLTFCSAAISLWSCSRHAAIGHVAAYQTPDMHDMDSTFSEGTPMNYGARAVLLTSWPRASSLWLAYMPLAIAAELSLFAASGLASPVVGPLPALASYFVSAVAVAIASGEASYFCGVLLFPSGIFIAPDASPFGLATKPVPARLPLAATALRLLLLPWLLCRSPATVPVLLEPTQATLVSLGHCLPHFEACGLLLTGASCYKAMLTVLVCTLVPLHLAVTLGLLLRHEGYRRGVRDDALIWDCAARHREILRWLRTCGQARGQFSLWRLLWQDLSCRRRRLRRDNSDMSSRGGAPFGGEDPPASHILPNSSDIP